MKYRIIAPQHIENCTIDLPPSKSIANRALVISALCGLDSASLNLPSDYLCDDIKAVKELISQDGNVVDVSSAGTGMRFGLAFLSVKEGKRILTGSESLCRRPIKELVDALVCLGADVKYVGREGYPPLEIMGNPLMKGGEVSVLGDISSQFVSALLMIAPKMEKGLLLHLVGSVVSRPYIDMTIGLMKQFGASIEWVDENTLKVDSGYCVDKSELDGFRLEADWSSASYLYEIMALSGSGDIEIKGLSDESMQGDKVGKHLFEMLAEMEKESDSTSNHNKPFSYDFSSCPDLVQTMAVACCGMDIPFCFTGVKTLKIKETDRLEALKNELEKFGFEIEISADTISWNGMHTDGKCGNCVVETYSDHRMAMAFAPLALKFGEILIDSPEVVSKSFPHYWDVLRCMGFEIREES